MRRSVLVVLALLLFATGPTALASTSLSTGTVLPGWTQVRTGDLYNTARRLLLDYALQARVSCGLVDVHLRESSGLTLRSIHVDTWFESSFDLTDLLTARDHHVILLERRYGRGEHLLLVVEAGRSLILAAC